MEKLTQRVKASGRYITDVANGSVYLCKKVYFLIDEGNGKVLIANSLNGLVTLNLKARRKYEND